MLWNPEKRCWGQKGEGLKGNSAFKPGDRENAQHRVVQCGKNISCKSERPGSKSKHNLKGKLLNLLESTFSFIKH